MYQRAVFVNIPKAESLDIEFSNIRFTVSMGFRKPKKQILRGIDGCFKSGELTAIMGPSGAGKSSLLNILTGLQKTGVTGKMQFRSKQGDHDCNQFKKESCYIQQEDMLHPFFSVDEVMMMAADLKLGQSLNRKAKQLILDDILETLDLTKCKLTRCDRLSGGQRKRLSIALELVDNPPVMFLDEPTTGLDSSASLQCVTMLQSLAKNGRTIVCTIHQPSASIYELFDHVYLLAEGRCVYQGDAKNTVNYLKKLGLNCPLYHNPADYMIEVVSKEYGDFNDKLALAATERFWRASTPIKSILYSNGTEKYTDEGKSTVLIRPPSEFSRFFILFKRCMIQLFRDWTVTHLKFLLHVLVGVFVGLLYVESGSDGSKAIDNVCFFLINAVYLCYTSMMPAVLKFPSEILILRKEQLNNWYKLRTFYAAFLLSNIPVQMLFVIVYSTIAYFLTSQPPDMDRFLMFLAVVILVSLVAEGFGLTLGAVVNPVNGTFLGAVSICAFILFAGFLILFNHMPTYMYYLTYTSYLRYGLEAMVHAIYGFNRPNLPCPSSETELTYCPYRMPKAVLKEMAMVENHYWRNVIILVIHVIALRLIAYITLKRKVSRL